MEWSEVLTNAQYNRLVDQGLKTLQQFATWAANNVCEEEIGVAWAPGEWLVIKNGSLYIKIDRSVSVDRESKPGEPPKPQYDYEKISAEKLADMVKEFKLTPALLEEAKLKIGKELAKKRGVEASDKLSPEDWQKIYEEFYKLLRSPAVRDLRRWTQLGCNQTHILLLTEYGLMKTNKTAPITKREQEGYLVGKIDIADLIEEFSIKAEALAEIGRRLEA